MLASRENQNPACGKGLSERINGPFREPCQQIIPKGATKIENGLKIMVDNRPRQSLVETAEGGCATKDKSYFRTDSHARLKRAPRGVKMSFAGP